ncbi:IF-2B-domain-containing protein [Eremomyces bilateralis CBS 781.70]|uniref:Translation initiation factor eIF2B subunit delta n=1 Tax=Eremomyces bilateralis CBS 781.70 TaxID=1392243 RepID=A0A6G1GB21_9PEZI|nr:IF-2B-domain-containing protein [Eremomyces bilateralis CBS 781.70]KAF1815049.1 IF-2B-domain-containing protein [Eremomyces bilateralis CBS 781.70]
MSTPDSISDPPKQVPVTAGTPSSQAPKPSTPAESSKLSNAELKKQQKAEKAARRLQKKGDQGPSNGQPTTPAQKAQTKPEKHAKPTQPRNQPAPPTLKPPGKATATRRGSSSVPNVIDSEVKNVALFKHLYSVPRRQRIEGASKDVHPAVVALGLQMSNYRICGSNARCIAMLLAFKEVIESYTTPGGTSLARHLTSHHLSPQIDYLKSCRPLSISMGNAIRYLKELIIKIDPAVPEHDAKATLLDAIDAFISERITVAGTIIAQTASTKIVSGDVVVTYAKSSIVMQTLLTAHRAGTAFRVVVVDSSPLFEGKRLASVLASHGLSVSYSLIAGASHAVTGATKVFLGAHAIMSNGRLYSRVGTAVVAMLAYERDIPVIVCCESVKFTERVALDSIVGNELAPAEELLAAGLSVEGKEGSKGVEDMLKKWRETPGLQALNVLYDVTPADYIKMVVTEFGSLPPSSVPAVLRNLSGNG